MQLMIFRIATCKTCGRIHHIGMYGKNGRIIEDSKLWLIDPILQRRCYDHGKVPIRTL